MQRIRRPPAEAIAATRIAQHRHPQQLREAVSASRVEQCRPVRLTNATSALSVSSAGSGFDTGANRLNRVMIIWIPSAKTIANAAVDLSQSTRTWWTSLGLTDTARPLSFATAMTGPNTMANGGYGNAKDIPTYATVGIITPVDLDKAKTARCRCLTNANAARPRSV